MVTEGVSGKWRSRVIAIISVGWTTYLLAYLYKLFFLAGLVIYPIVHRAIAIGLLCILAFLVYPAKKVTYDIIAMVFVVAACGYIVLNAQQLIRAWGDASVLEIVLGMSLIVCLLEIVRRTTNWVLPVILIFFFFYTVYSNHFPGLLHSVGFSYSRTVAWIYLSGEGLWGMVTGIVVTVVAAFIIFGGFLRSIGADRFYIDVGLSLLGAVRGGSAKAAVVASSLFGTLSGSIAANIATTGTVTIPLMKGSGYNKELAGGIEACASTGGMFLPPVMGATAFLMAEFLQVSYWSICIAAFLPALIYYLVLFLQVDLEAAKSGISGLSREQVPSLTKTLRSGWQFLLPLVILVVLLGVLRYSAETSIMYTIASLVAISFFKKETRLTPSRLLDAMKKSAQGMLSIGPLCAAIMIIVASLSITGAGANLTSELSAIGGENVFFVLLFAAAASFILGMGMTAVTCYILTVVVVAPILINLGVEPIAAHLFLFYFGCLSFITPPVCIGAYVAAGIADGEPWKTGIQAMRFGAAAYLVPWVFVFNPGLVAVGSAIDIGLALIYSALGGFSVAIALAGYFLTHVRHWERIIFAMGGISLFVPVVSVKIAGAALLTLVVSNHVMRARRAKTST